MKGEKSLKLAAAGALPRSGGRTTNAASAGSLEQMKDARSFPTLDPKDFQWGNPSPAQMYTLMQTACAQHAYAFHGFCPCPWFMPACPMYPPYLMSAGFFSGAAPMAYAGIRQDLSPSSTCSGPLADPRPQAAARPALKHDAGLVSLPSDASDTTAAPPGAHPGLGASPGTTDLLLGEEELLRFHVVDDGGALMFEASVDDPCSDGGSLEVDDAAWRGLLPADADPSAAAAADDLFSSPCECAATPPWQVPSPRTPYLSDAIAAAPHLLDNDLYMGGGAGKLSLSLHGADLPKQVRLGVCSGGVQKSRCLQGGHVVGRRGADVQARGRAAGGRPLTKVWPHVAPTDALVTMMDVE